MAKYFKVEDLAEQETRIFTDEATGSDDWIFALSDFTTSVTELGPDFAVSHGPSGRFLIIDSVEGNPGGGIVENVRGGDGPDEITGNSLDNILLGDVDLKDFGRGNVGGSDILNGFAGNDWIFGGGRADRISGGSEDDIINGGRGGDTLEGGSGADIFQFSANPKLIPDSITDFSLAEGDSFQLDNVVFRGLKRGDLAAKAFAINDSGRAKDADDRIIYERDSGTLYFDVDGKGGKARVEFASIDSYVAIDHKSFDVIHDWTRHTDWL